MDSKLVCTASTGHRHSCGTDCDGCGYLKADRRRQPIQWMDWSFPDRRTVSNWVPGGYQLAGDGFTAAAERSESTGAGYVWPVILLLMSFNILDCLLTARALSMGFEEANPLMAGLFNASLPLGMLAKTLVVGAGAMILWKFRHMAMATRGMTIVTACYGAVVVYHLSFQLSMH